MSEENCPHPGLLRSCLPAFRLTCWSHHNVEYYDKYIVDHLSNSSYTCSILERYGSDPMPTLNELYERYHTEPRNEQSVDLKNDIDEVAAALKASEAAQLRL